MVGNLQSVSNYVDTIFKHFDHNNDGLIKRKKSEDQVSSFYIGEENISLTFKEDKVMSFYKLFENADSHFKPARGNSDGFVSKQELKDYITVSYPVVAGQINQAVMNNLESQELLDNISGEYYKPE